MNIQLAVVATNLFSLRLKMMSMALLYAISATSKCCILSGLLKSKFPRNRFLDAQEKKSKHKSSNLEFC